jgi:hypothetical protein
MKKVLVVLMKNAFVLIFFVGSLAVVNAQTTIPAQPPAVLNTEALEMKETTFDFGLIPQGKPVHHSFEITNVGKEPMVILNVQTSCGCTTPEWSREPLAPLYNQNQSKQVKIRGTVWKAPETPAPLNSSLQLLKNKNQ